MPPKDWGYLLAVVLGFMVFYYWARARMSHRKPPASKIGAKEVVGRYLPDGLMVLVTTGGTTALGAWGVKEVGPALGFCWVVGTLVGGITAVVSAASAIAHGHLGGLNKEDKTALAKRSRLWVSLYGVEYTNSHLSELRETLVRQRHVDDSKKSLQKRISELERRTRDQAIQITGSQSESRKLEEERTYLGEALDILSGVLLTSSVADYSNWPPKEFDDILQFLVNAMAASGGGQSSSFAASIYMWSPTAAPRNISARVYSRSVGASQVNQGIWEQNVEMHSTDSLLGLVVSCGRPVLWPEDKTMISKSQYSHAIRKTSVPANWPAALVIPIPYCDGRTAEKFVRRPYAAIVIRRKRVTAIPDALRRLCYASSPLIDLLVNLSDPKRIHGTVPSMIEASPVGVPMKRSS